jgi:hypothetical protein
MALDDMDRDDTQSNGAVSSDNRQIDTLMSEFEKVATSALNNAEKFVRENPLTALAGVGAMGALIALAVSRRQPQTLDRRLIKELNRHTEDVSRAIRRNASALSNTDTAHAVESFVERLVGSLAKLPETVTTKVDELRK